MTRIIGSLVTYNEADRYLEDCLRWMRQYLDEIFVYDDRSTDDTVDIARSLGCKVCVRKEHSASFIEHEGQFRSDAWNALRRHLRPRAGNWILSFDADEFLVGDNVSENLEEAIQHANRYRKMGVVLPFPEIFKYEEGHAFMRTDGFWGNIKGSRLFVYREGGKFRQKPMGCGSEPTYVSMQKSSHVNFSLHMLHFGYARQEDQQAKFKRYSALQNHGHNDSHIQSIVSKPTLKEWTGPLPIIT